MNWQLNKLQYPVYNLGEGKRIGIWVQGCSLACRECVNQTLWDQIGGKSIPVMDVFNWILEVNTDYDGITLTGGEPFQQYVQLIAFLHLVKTRTRLSVHCYSGYYLHELEELFPDRLFLKYLDILVDGRFEADLYDSSNIRGSSNQNIYRIVNSQVEKVEAIRGSKKWSVRVTNDNRIYMAGIPLKQEMNDLTCALKKVGISKKFK
jgi:anaerobic ribonucleoside-triphosphate reductase activating protein